MSQVRLVHWAVRVGRGTPALPGALRNTYLVVRAPWLQQAATSVTCWAEEEPQYDYTLVRAANGAGGRRGAVPAGQQWPALAMLTMQSFVIVAFA